jgi:hypothetical protein
MQLLGRAIAGLPFNGGFSTLPPHFDSLTQAYLVRETWIRVLPEYDSYPIGFKSCLPYLLASVMYHENFLKGVLDPQHPLFQSPLYTSGVAAALRGKAALDGDRTRMQTTGVPAMLQLSTQMEQKFNSVRKEITSNCQEMFV